MYKQIVFTLYIQKMHNVISFQRQWGRGEISPKQVSRFEPLNLRSAAVLSRSGSDAWVRAAAEDSHAPVHGEGERQTILSDASHAFPCPHPLES